ncbi:beta-glucosidase BglX [Algoriphagus sp. NBT04N3]|uniref:beta-glucosidase BglX n=1 Tax=Algoriphagus sp. NBT04N3 TaxID=2705473 RepID=UPI001C637E0C|nr:beta-glucosidase BglX [Algoriphagus sp. NBT04N3]QYH39340.1 beta-glucosidase BglX [Algoriphagus sp. NBT04N3]
MKNIPFFLLLALIFACNSGSNSSSSSSESPYEEKIDSLLSIMTLEEKIGQMNQYNGFWEITGPTPQEGAAAMKYENLRKGLVGSMLNVTGVEEVRKVQKIAVEESRLGIPLIIGYDMIHGFQTMSPIPLAEASSWDMEAIRRSSEIGAREAAAAGINWTFAPMVDIGRDARWGRVMEGAGEDPYLGGQIAIARVKGYQGEDLSDPLTLAACVKHFAGYGFSESGRDYNSVDVGTSTLYNIILPPFKAALDAGARTFMNAFNDLNGIPATGNAFLQREILKEKWGFDGFVVSDWGSIAEMIPHGFAIDSAAAASYAVTAGSDMDMESYIYLNELKKLVESGEVDEKLIDDAVRRILRIKYELGLFDDPYKYCNDEREKEIIGSEEHIQGVLEMAKKSIVLLKNEGQILPLKKEGMRIAVIGDLADDKDSPIGNWRAEAISNSAVSVLEGLQNYPGNSYQYAKGADLILGPTAFITEVKINTDDRSGFAEAKRVAANADVVLLILGENGFQSGEARSRSDIGLPGLQQELMEEIQKVNPKSVLVNMSGRPLDLSWADANIPAILQVWHLGSQSGNAIAQVLFGDYNPSGKLPMSFPRSVGQLPIYYNQKSTGRPTPPGGDVVFWSHYSDISNDPLYPFGHGLSYSNFTYSGLKVSNEGRKVTVSVDVKNESERPGEEVIQLYIHDIVASVTRPNKELKAFEKTLIEAGQTRTITFELDERHLGFYDNQGNYIVEPGAFDIYVGGSSNTSLGTQISIQ